MPEAVIINTRPAEPGPTGKFPSSTTALGRAALAWAQPVKSTRLRRSSPLPENVCILTRPAVAAEWPAPPHVLAMMHLVVAMDAEQAARAARQLAAIYAMSGDSFTGMAIAMLDEVK